ETAGSDLLLHVVDSASSDRDQQIIAVNQVLAEIGAANVPQIVVWNKIDATSATPGLERDEYARIARVRLSARAGAGVELLRGALVEVAREHPSRNQARNLADPVDALA
ncbi:MAG: GTPase HflX, partial [Proteobacteria bacterium]|nr:GTPase HflX [Pseudomonadota bacterium]